MDMTFWTGLVLGTLFFTGIMYAAGTTIEFDRKPKRLVPPLWGDVLRENPELTDSDRAWLKAQFTYGQTPEPVTSVTSGETLTVNEDRELARDPDHARALARKMRLHRVEEIKAALEEIHPDRGRWDESRFLQLKRELHDILAAERDARFQDQLRERFAEAQRSVKPMILSD